jgi:sulfite reductase alpha subunit-like flavoprotein
LTSQEYEKSFQPGTFTIDVAFSREDPEQKVYVQNLLQERAAELRKLVLEESACVYVCGDAGRMAKDGFKTMTQIIAEDAQFNDSLRDAETHLKGLKKRSRWFEDVW